MTKKPFGMDMGMASANPMLEWWQQQWMKGGNPMARMQLAWMESMAEAMQFEAQFLKAIAESGERLSKCFDGEGPTSPEELQECYQKLVQEVSDAQMKRMEHATQLTHDFRKRIWEEI
ncbi:glucosamine 6-phosphate synthetase-like amidotransferase/phosphosugar isomerase protein [Halomonas campaniensis]|uniref:Glucosamine 6-phosphate synthetase-like amidotransferase/phosphosugar isomerase protein n=1 Tax=Halomonas campaniensis TaxID=213554 RepID=A0A7W5K249_9GAMM|nr:hypothetical protein [Halomonas campaniensis]MBB3330569.1 glucosamine 6-phosphate synthetase-like amidotransferase/phosphosugar isomerase protein [Halomonas campaniensis]